MDVVITEQCSALLRSEEGKSRWMSCWMIKLQWDKWAQISAETVAVVNSSHTLPEVEVIDRQIEVQLFRGLC